MKTGFIFIHQKKINKSEKIHLAKMHDDEVFAGWTEDTEV